MARCAKSWQTPRRLLEDLVHRRGDVVARGSNWKSRKIRADEIDDALEQRPVLGEGRRGVVGEDRAARDVWRIKAKFPLLAVGR